MIYFFKIVHAEHPEKTFVYVELCQRTSGQGDEQACVVLTVYAGELGTPEQPRHEAYARSKALELEQADIRAERSALDAREVFLKNLKEKQAL